VPGYGPTSRRPHSFFLPGAVALWPIVLFPVWLRARKRLMRRSHRVVSTVRSGPAPGRGRSASVSRHRADPAAAAAPVPRKSLPTSLKSRDPDGSPRMSVGFPQAVQWNSNQARFTMRFSACGLSRSSSAAFMVIAWQLHTRRRMRLDAIRQSGFRALRQFAPSVMADRHLLGRRGPAGHASIAGSCPLLYKPPATSACSLS